MTSIRTELLFRLEVSGRPTELGDTPSGRRRFVQVTGGRFEGPVLAGEVLPVGADNALIRPDGVFEPDVTLVLRTGAGALIRVSYRGRFHAPAAVMERLLRRDPGVDPASYYLRTAVFFETSDAGLAWLNGILAIGTGTPLPTTEAGVGIRYDIFQVL